MSRESREVLAIFREPLDKRFGDATALARLLEVSSNLGEIAARARQIGQTRHLERRSRGGPLIEMLAHVLTHVFARMASTLGNRGVERRAQGIGPRDGHGIANGIFRRREGASGHFRLDPLGGIRCQFDFHGHPVSFGFDHTTETGSKPKHHRLSAPSHTRGGGFGQAAPFSRPKSAPYLGARARPVLTWRR